jgi:hypothetical protein
MIKVIKPKDYNLYQPKIEALLDLFSVYQNVELTSEEKRTATFMIAEDKERGVYGGAFLIQKPMEKLDEKISNILHVFSSHKKKVWTAKLCFCVDGNEPFSDLENFDLCQNFYEMLLKKLIKFGKKEKTKFLMLTLRPTDLFRSKSYGHWSYLLEIEPKDSMDSLFHGLLSLKVQKSALYKSAWALFKRSKS